MASIDIFPLSIGGVSPPLNLLASVLGGSSSASTTLSYPMDLGSNPNYGHAVTFTAVNPIYTNLTSFLNAPLNYFNPQTMLNQQNTTSLLPYISMYLPDTLNMTYSHNWGEVSLTNAFPGGAGTGFLVGAAADIANLENHGSDRAKENFKNLFGKAGIGAVTSVFGSSDLGSAVGTSIGQVQNPHLQLLYKGIGLREFQFEFIFTPSSASEAQMVDSIIKQFTWWSVPDTPGSNSGVISNNYLTPPQLFKINFAFLGNNGIMGAVTNFFNNLGTNIIGSQLTAALSPSNVTPSSGSPAKIFQVYNTCALTNMNVDYAPNGWASFGDGFPVQTRLTLQFKETDIVTKQTINPTTSLSSLPSLSSMNEVVSYDPVTNAAIGATAYFPPGASTLADLGGSTYSSLTNMAGFP
jgi:hypothetical protein